MSKKIFLLFLIGFIAGCEPSEFAAEMQSTEEIDEALSTLSVETPVIADGITVSNIRLKLRNRKGRPVLGYRMKMQVSGQNNVMVPCTASDVDGHSLCQVMSTFAETKNLILTGKSIMRASITFTPAPPTKMLFSFVSTGDSQTAPLGHKFTTSSGVTETPTTLKDGGGFTRLRTSHFGTLFDPEAM